MNPSSIFAMISGMVTLATQVAPLVSHMVPAAKAIEQNGIKLASDIRKLDAAASLHDLEALFHQAEVSIPDVTNLVNLSKSVIVPVIAASAASAVPAQG